MNHPFVLMPVLYCAVVFKLITKCLRYIKVSNILDGRFQNSKSSWISTKGNSRALSFVKGWREESNLQGGNIAGRCSKSEINRSRNRKNNHKAYELTLNILFSESTQPVCTLQLKYRTSFRTWKTPGWTINFTAISPLCVRLQFLSKTTELAQIRMATCSEPYNP